MYPMSEFHAGLSKIFSRKTSGKVVLTIESPDWAAQSPPSVHPPVELGEHGRRDSPAAPNPKPQGQSPKAPR